MKLSKPSLSTIIIPHSYATDVKFIFHHFEFENLGTSLVLEIMYSTYTFPRKHLPLRQNVKMLPHCVEMMKNYYFLNNFVFCIVISTV